MAVARTNRGEIQDQYLDCTDTLRVERACAFIKINKKTGEVINAQYYPVSVVFHNPILEVGAVKLPKVSSNRPYNIVKDFLEAIATFVTKAPGRFCSPTPMDVISTFQISVLRKVLKEPD